LASESQPFLAAELTVLRTATAEPLAFKRIEALEALGPLI
jgi:hypothetical protein